MEKILFVCTANVCRSPMAEAFLRSELQARSVNVQVQSAGFFKSGSPADKTVLRVMRELGFDVSDHHSAKVLNELSREPDLIIVMARDHLRSLAKLDPRCIDKAFTFKEFVRLAGIEGPRQEGEKVSAYIERVRAGRSASSLSSPGKEEDVEDPIGGRKVSFSRCAAELQRLVRALAEQIYPHQEFGRSHELGGDIGFS